MKKKKKKLKAKEVTEKDKVVTEKDKIITLTELLDFLKAKLIPWHKLMVIHSTKYVIRVTSDTVFVLFNDNAFAVENCETLDGAVGGFDPAVTNAVSGLLACRLVDPLVVGDFFRWWKHVDQKYRLDKDIEHLRTLVHQHPREVRAFLKEVAEF